MKLHGTLIRFSQCVVFVTSAPNNLLLHFTDYTYKANSLTTFTSYLDFYSIFSLLTLSHTHTVSIGPGKNVRW